MNVIKKILFKIKNFIVKNWKFVSILFSIILIFSKMLTSEKQKELKNQIKQTKDSNKKIINKTNKLQKNIKKDIKKIDKDTNVIINNKKDRDAKANKIFNVGD